MLFYQVIRIEVWFGKLTAIRRAVPALSGAVNRLRIVLRLWFAMLTIAQDISPSLRGVEMLRGLDSNQGPSGYEPDEIPLLYPAVFLAFLDDLKLLPN